MQLVLKFSWPIRLPISLRLNKTKPTKASVDDFISRIKNSRRHTDTLVALSIYKDVTGLPPVMWGPSIIGFGTHHYVYK